MLILRIRRAESALADGRLDEAFEIARSEDVRAHRRGQKLLTGLARAFVARGQTHLAAKQLAQAMADCERAAGAGGNLSDVCDLRAAVTAAMSNDREEAGRQQKLLNAAREHAQNGRLSAAAEMIADPKLCAATAETLLRETEAKRSQAEGALQRARAALERSDYQAAMGAILEARRLHSSSPTVADAASQITNAVLEQIRRSVDSGRLDVASLLLERLRSLQPDAVSVHEWSGFLDQCVAAAQAISAGQVRRAVEILRKLNASTPGAAWVQSMMDEASRAAQSLETLQSGPLGWLSGNRPTADRDAADVNDPLLANPAKSQQRPEPTPMTPLPARLLFHVDAVGTILALRNSTVRIGPASRARPCDIQLATDPGLSAITIERRDEDYFLSCEKPIRVNQGEVREKLLMNGDTIAVSARCRLKFELPHPASTSAVLTLSGAPLPGSDVRKIVLLDRAMVLGPSLNAHIRADQLRESAVLLVRQDRLFCRTGETVTVDDHPMDREAGLPVGAKIRVGAVRLVMTAALS